MELRQLFGTSLRRCRRLRGLTQAQLAETAGLSLEMIGRLERGVVAPSFETISTLAAALLVTPAVLFGARSRNVDANRRAVLERIDNLLTPASEVELKQVERVLKALLGE